MIYIITSSGRTSFLYKIFIKCVKDYLNSTNNVAEMHFVENFVCTYKLWFCEPSLQECWAQS